MQVINEVTPGSPAQLAEMQSPGPDGPIFMINMLRFREKAVYADGRRSELSGRDAYMIYGEAVAKLLPKFGGELIFSGDVTFLALGQVEEMWHEVAIASYPDRPSLLRMAMSAEWAEIAAHREAGLEGQLNIETVGRLFGPARRP